MTTLGQDRVRLDFNPSKIGEVELIKAHAAQLIDLCEGMKDKDPRLAALAQTAFETGAMWGVKLATAEPSPIDSKVDGELMK